METRFPFTHRFATAALLAGSLFLGASVSGCSTAQPAVVRPAVASAATATGAPVYEKEILSKTYRIDKKYKSMLGPDSYQAVSLLDGEEPELLWITGYKAVVVGKDGAAPMSQEFMCHSNLDFDVYKHREAFDHHLAISGRLFTLSQGQQDIQLPEGYGIPVMSTQPLDLVTQVLNLNLPNPDLDVRHRVTIRFVRDSEVKQPMRALYQSAVQGFKSLSGQPAHYGKAPGESEQHGEGCSVGLSAVSGEVDKDAFGKQFTGHWVVKPGREVNRTLVTEFLNLQFDTKAYYIAVHLHPFAESLELIDKTTGERVFKSNVRGYDDKVGIEHIDYFTSQEGLQLYADHEYELVSVYNNTTSEDVDSMAVMYLYVHDPYFKKPDRARLEKLASQPRPAPAAPKRGM